MAQNNIKNVSIESLPDDQSSFTSDSDVTRDFGSFTSIPLSVSSNNNAILPVNNASMEGRDRDGGSTGPVIDCVCVQSVSDVTFGNKIIYKGPVTIENVALDKEDGKRG